MACCCTRKGTSTATWWSTRGSGSWWGGRGVGLFGCNFSLWGYDNFGIPVVDSTGTGGRLRVLYYPVADTRGADNFDAIHDCFRDSGLSLERVRPPRRGVD